MNRLRIVVEQTGPESYEVLYCGTDRAKAEQVLHTPTRADRALFVKPAVSAYNRPTLSAPTVAKPTEAAPEPPAKTHSKKK